MQSNPQLQRLDRCFIVGKNKDQQRAALRVLAGVRLREGDPESLGVDELKRMLDACAEPTR